MHHITDAGKPLELVKDKEGTFSLNQEYDAWINNDGLLTSWLLGVITKEILSLIVGVDFAHQAWKSLEDQLLPRTKKKEMHLKDKFVALKKGSLSVEEYQRKFKQIYDNLAAINKLVSDLDKVFQLAKGLGPKYQDFQVAMLTKPPYPTFSHFCDDIAKS